MLILLPPSETKRAGGSRAPLRLDRLAYPELSSRRTAVVDALVELSRDEDESARVLKLGATQRSEIAVNAALLSGPTLPAIDRYTGVLFDALDAASLDPSSRRWIGSHVRIHSAPFGLIGALDRIPSYRLGAGVSLPGLASLKKIWADATTAAIAEEAPRFVLDLRSEAYVALGPVPAGVSTSYVRVVTAGSDGAVRALNHFNKHAKGQLVRQLAEQRPRVASARGFQAWAESAGWQTQASHTGELQLFA